jgi:hypothetical protein
VSRAAGLGPAAAARWPGPGAGPGPARGLLLYPMIIIDSMMMAAMTPWVKLERVGRTVRGNCRRRRIVVRRDASVGAAAANHNCHDESI